MKPIILYSTLVALLMIVSPSNAQQLIKPEVKKSVCFFKTKSIRESRTVLPGIHKEEQREFRNHFPYGTKKMKTLAEPVDKAVLQKAQGSIKIRGALLNFEGVGNENGIRPADPNGEVGPNHYIQTVNSSFAIWDKDGNLLYGPADNKTLWESFPGGWNDLFWADPVFKYDHMVDRWVISSLAASLSGGTNYQMVAVSVTPDPLGEYYCYAFEFELFNDYPKMAIWPDGYYITYNMYDNSDPVEFLYSLVTVIDSEAMLAGEPEITMIQFEIPDPDSERFFPMAADLRGKNIPEDEPCFIITVDNHNPENPWELSLDVYEFQTDWKEPENSQFGIVAQFDLGTFESFIPYGPGAPQKGSSINVMTVPLYLMYPVTYRQLNDHDAIVCCHTIWDGNIHYIKWYELRKEEAGWYMYQSGNYAPGDEHCYIPSISINGNGDIALGYAVSSKDIYPSIRLTGRRAEDPMGTMSFQEIELFKGLNYANTYISFYDQNMWGDYASMMVDPVDDTTFWFTHTYTRATISYGNWATRIFSFNLAGETTLPYADAGNDALTCNSPFFTTQGYAENYSSVMWTTSGDGNFTSNYNINATYLRGPDDLANGQATLTIRLSGYEAGMATADSMILYVNKEPEVYAGPDIIIDTGGLAILQGEVNFSYEYFWASLGDGSFTDSSLLDAIYTPGTGDIENGQVVLTLIALEVSPCNGSVNDSLTVFILPDGIQNHSDDDRTLMLYPNPASKFVSVQSNLPSDDPLLLQVIGSSGKIIFTGAYVPLNGHFDLNFDVSYLVPGIYFVRLKTGGMMLTRKLIVKE